MRSVPGVLFGLLVLVGAVAAICVPIGGRTADEWAPVVGQWARRRRRAETGYRSSSPEAGTRIGLDGETQAELSLPPALEGLEMLEVPYGSAQVGVIEDRRLGTFTTAMAVHATSFALRDAAEQERALEAWGDVLASCARDGSPI